MEVVDEVLGVSDVEVLGFDEDGVGVVGGVEVEVGEGFDLVHVGVDIGVDYCEGLDGCEDHE